MLKKRLRRDSVSAHSADREMRKAMSNKLKVLASAEMSPAMLLRLEQTVRHYRELLVIDKHPEALPSKKFKVSSLGPMNPAPSSAETFGASIIREAIPAIAAMFSPQQSPPQATPFELVNAIAIARDRGLDDLANSLESKLLGQMPVATPQVSPPVSVQAHQGQSSKDPGSAYWSETPDKDAS